MAVLKGSVISKCKVRLAVNYNIQKLLVVRQLTCPNLWNPGINKQLEGQCLIQTQKYNVTSSQV